MLKLLCNETNYEDLRFLMLRNFTVDQGQNFAYITTKDISELWLFYFNFLVMTIYFLSGTHLYIEILIYFYGHILKLLPEWLKKYASIV